MIKNKRNKYGIRIGFFGILINLILGIIKVFIGLMSNSISVLADAINNIFDMFSSIMTIVVFYFSNKKPNKNYPFGYARIEYIFSLIISIVMLVMGILFIKKSIIKIINPSILEINYIVFIVLVISIIGKYIQMFIFNKYSKILKSNVLKVTSIETRNDIITTSSILISMIIMKIYNINIDGYLGLIVSIYIVCTSIKSIKESIDTIIGLTPDINKVNEIKNKLLSYDLVNGVHDLFIHNYGACKDFATVHIEVESNNKLSVISDLVNEIEFDFINEKDINLTIHVDIVN